MMVSSVTTSASAWLIPSKLSPSLVAASVSDWLHPNVHSLTLAATSVHDDAFLEQLPLILRDKIAGFFPAELQWFVGAFLAIFVIINAFAFLFSMLTLVERKVLGRVQNRPGPNRTGPFGLLQPFADGLKMLTKEDIVPNSADKVLHVLAPVALLTFSILTLAVIPYGRHLVPLDIDSAVLYFFAAGAASELAIFMAGWASRNKFSLLAAMRALAQLISYELPLLLSFVPVVMLAGTLSMSGIVDAQEGWIFGFLPRWYVFTPWGFAAFMIFLIAALAESNRSPFDLPEAESELIAGHLTEYSGFKYALFFMAEYFGMIALSGMAITLFLGGWRAPLPFLEVIPSYVWFTLKLLTLLLVFIWIRATFPRLRIDQLTRLSWKFLVPLCLINLGVAAVWVLTGSAPLLVRWALTAVLIVVPFILMGRKLSTQYRPRTYRYAT
jgi:NADH-quinone oxidoreductase subunit H